MVEESGKKGRVNLKVVLIGLIVVVAVIVSGFAMVTVSRAFETPPSDFVTLPTTPISKTGEVAVFDSVAPIEKGSLNVGVTGYLETASGQPVAGANVYVQYYFEGAYRTQVGTTDANGLFVIQFPFNWTGWLSLTMIYFGDGQHQGVQQVVSLQGESL
jgi:hypothetical protein